MFTAGVEQTISLPSGQEFTLGRLSVAVLRTWRDWVANRVGDPFELVERFLGKIPEAESVRQLRAAEDLRDQLRYFNLGTPLAMKMLATEEGGAVLFKLLLQIRQPAATDDDGLAVAMHLIRTEATAATLARAEGTEGNARAAAQAGV